MTLPTSMGRQPTLPSDLTSFVGREREVDAVKRLLTSSRMITLTGIGGVGKTRLALRTASEVQRAFQDGVCFAELAALTDGALVVQAVADALGIQAQVRADSLDSLIDHLAARRLLLVLDNCEHLVAPCASVADSLLRFCPDVRILVTSRQPLHVQGEHVVPVAPLPLTATLPARTAEEAERSPAVQLFVERAAAVLPEFALVSGNEVAVAEICQRLDGIPLAIEQAAGRLRFLSVDQLRERLDDRFALLTGLDRTSLPRQRTLRAVIDWSHELCSSVEQVLWSRLSVFRDGFEMDAVESVCAFGEISPGAVLTALAGLVDKSIVTAEPIDGRMRYFLPETLAEYGRERLSPAEQTDLRARHRDWCADLVTSAEARWFSSDQVDLFTRMRREHANIRAALGTCASQPDGAAVGLGMASSLRFYWVMNGSMAEGRHWLDRFLAQYDAPPAARLKALRVGAHLAALLVDYPGAEALLAEAGRLADEVADRASRADVAQVQGLHALFVAEVDRAAGLFRAAAEGHREAGNVAALAYDELQLALATMSSGDLDGAVSLIEDALHLCEPIGESWTTALAWFALGVVSASSGDHARAKDAARRSIRLRQLLGDVRNIGLNFETLAWSAAASGDCEVAAQLFGAARAVEQSVGVSIRAIGYVAELHERYERVSREALGDAEYDRWWTVGLERVFEEAVDVALTDEKPRARPRPSPRTGPSTTTAAAFGLTRREWEIAQLVGKGMSNRAIAAQLVISPRTAETHVEHILVKLNFTSRVQVAAWLAQQRVEPD